MIFAEAILQDETVINGSTPLFSQQNPRMYESPASCNYCGWRWRGKRQNNFSEGTPIPLFFIISGVSIGTGGDIVESVGKSSVWQSIFKILASACLRISSSVAVALVPFEIGFDFNPHKNIRNKFL